MLPKKPCKWCKEVNPLHWPYQCFKRPEATNIIRRSIFRQPRHGIKNISDKTRTSASSMKRAWFKMNPPDGKGEWECYLQIADNCPRKMAYQYLTLEHVMPKVKAPELKFDPKNIRPSCAPCNRVKGSKTIEKLAKTYPHLRVYLTDHTASMVE